MFYNNPLVSESSGVGILGAPIWGGGVREREREREKGL